MKTLSNIHEIIPIIRPLLIEQSELDTTKVLNAMSPNGEYLSKELSEQIQVSIQRNESMIIFELRKPSGENWDLTTMDEDDLLEYKNLEMHVIIYGDDSDDLALKLVSRLRSENVVSQVYDKGVYIKKVDTPNEAHEEINNQFWKRTDFDIQLYVQLKVSQINEPLHFEELNERKIRSINDEIL